MTTPADDSAVEEAFEAFLAGRAVPDEAAGLAAFAGAVRSSATQPGRPNAALAELLATGLLTDQSSPSTRTAVAAGALPSRRPRVRRRRFAMIFPVLLAKFLSAGAIAQAATGAGVVVVAFTGAGATGLLGGGVQDGLTSVVGASEAPGDDVTATAPATGDQATVTDPGTVPTTPAETTVPVAPTEVAVDPAVFVANGPAGYSSFGEWVSECAHDPALRARLRAEGISFGHVVRTWAHKKGITEADLAEEGVDLAALTDDDAGSTTARPTDAVEADNGGESRDRNWNDHGGREHGKGGSKGGEGDDRGWNGRS